LRKGESTKTDFMVEPFYSTMGSYRVLSVGARIQGDKLKTWFKYREVDARLEQVRGQVLQAKPKMRPWRTSGPAPV
jgi:hypothetical protein